MSCVMFNLTMLDKLSIVDRFSRVIKNFLIISFIKNILILCLLRISHCHITLIDLVYSFSKLNHHTYSEDLLSEQHSESFKSITIKDDEHWKINDILNFRCYQDWIQYKVKWKDLDRNDEWYYVDKEKFNNSEKVLNEFHKLYSSKLR